MKDELESIHKNEVWDLVELPERSKPIGCKFSKPKKAPKIRWKDIKWDLLQKDLLKMKELSIGKLFLLYLKKTYSKS